MRNIRKIRDIKIAMSICKNVHAANASFCFSVSSHIIFDLILCDQPHAALRYLRIVCLRRLDDCQDDPPARICTLNKYSHAPLTSIGSRALCWLGVIESLDGAMYKGAHDICVNLNKHATTTQLYSYLNIVFIARYVLLLLLKIALLAVNYC